MIINPHIKNKRTGVQQDVQDRSSHYGKLLSTKACIDNTWHKGDLRILPARSHMQRSLELTRNEENLRLMSKIVSIDRRPDRSRTEAEERKSTLKNRYREYQKELSIAEDNIRMLKRMENIESELSNKKMKEFSAEMRRYTKLAKPSLRNIEQIDEMFYRHYKKSVVRHKAEPGPDKVSYRMRHRKLQKQLISLTGKKGASMREKKTESKISMIDVLD
jgi:hypothetical protein